ncbi:DUF1667 domain-containing protein [Clostridium tertium]|uniref:Molybdopterin oxidoreductase n=1 Tax=Clostridium tertium TaxID=1559 RepID=A0A6N3FHE9_9CLOT
MIKNLICICCPMGCHLEVDIDEKSVKGNSCKRGEEYGIMEVTNPIRIVTTTVKLLDSSENLLPVKTKEGIPKHLIFKCMEELKRIKVKAPIEVGDIVLKNILDTGIDVLSTKSVYK